MKLKRDTKGGEESTCRFKIDIKNLTYSDLSTRKCQNRNFDKILLSKVENLWALNLRWSYVSWQWRMIQKLKRNWLVTLKLTWTSQNLTRALEKSIFFSVGSLWPKYTLWATKVQRSYLSWHWGVMQILKNDWPVVWKKTWEIWQIFIRALESVKIETLMGSFCPK